MPTPRKLDLNALAQQEGGRAEISIKSPEDEDEKRLRLRKEYLEFLVKEIGPYVLAAAFVVAMSVYCLVLLHGEKTFAPERDRAWQALSAILGGVVGVVFGKATTKSS